jgi:hypothetical protein
MTKASTAGAAGNGKTAQLAKKMQNLQLNDLINRSTEELDELFLLATTPTIEEIHGATAGRVLSGELFLKEQAGRFFINLPWMPWKGKIFEPLSKTRGKGINRMEGGPLKGKLFHFETSIIDPLVGDDQVFTLNYDLRGNPWFIRQIRDDVKKLRDGLFLGTANMKWKGEHIFVLYFALEVPN